VTHDELLARIAKLSITPETNVVPSELCTALMAVLEVHAPFRHCGNPNCWSFVCGACNPVKSVNDVMWPCPTVQAIEREIR